jgi:molybdopterin/thiamine biosynthesis adenylyltransferase
VEKEGCNDWSNFIDLLLSAITISNLESFYADVDEIASSLDKAEEHERDAADRERLRIQHEIERLQHQLAALGDES